MTIIRKEVAHSTFQDPKWRSREVRRTMMRMWGFDPDKPFTLQDDAARGVRTLMQEVANRPRSGRTVKEALGFRHQYKKK